MTSVVVTVLIVLTSRFQREDLKGINVLKNNNATDPDDMLSEQIKNLVRQLFAGY